MSEEKKEQAIDAAKEKAGELSEEAIDQVSGGFSFGETQGGTFGVGDYLKIKPRGSV